jgi:hypothetical protein
MAHAQGSLDGVRRLAVLQQTLPRADPPADRDLLDALGDILEETRAAADGAERVDQNTLAMADVLAGIEHRFAAMRLALTGFAVSQVLILSLILWRVW